MIASRKFVEERDRRQNGCWMDVYISEKDTRLDRPLALSIIIVIMKHILLFDHLCLT